MKYVKNECIVTIGHRAHYTTMRIIGRDNKLIYESDFLPKLGSRIEAEENAERIANNYTK